MACGQGCANVMIKSSCSNNKQSICHLFSLPKAIKVIDLLRCRVELHALHLDHWWKSLWAIGL